MRLGLRSWWQPRISVLVLSHDHPWLDMPSLKDPYMLGFLGSTLQKLLGLSFMSSCATISKAPVPGYRVSGPQELRI